VQQDVPRLGETAIDFPPVQDPASFDLTAFKAKTEPAMKDRQSQ
jgi:hypothetical protein